MNSNWSYSPETPKLWQNLFWPLWPWPFTSNLELLHANGDSSWKFQDETTRGTLWKRCHRRTDRTVLRAALSQLKKKPRLYRTYVTTGFFAKSRRCRVTEMILAYSWNIYHTLVQYLSHCLYTYHMSIQTWLTYVATAVTMKLSIAFWHEPWSGENWWFHLMNQLSGSSYVWFSDWPWCWAVNISNTRAYCPPNTWKLIWLTNCTGKTINKENLIVQVE